MNLPMHAKLVPAGETAIVAGYMSGFGNGFETEALPGARTGPCAWTMDRPAQGSRTDEGARPRRAVTTNELLGRNEIHGL